MISDDTFEFQEELVKRKTNCCYLLGFGGEVGQVKALKGGFFLCLTPQNDALLLIVACTA